MALLLLLCLIPFESSAQQRKKERQDSLLNLLNAEYARVFSRPGNREYREVKGPATFLHNGAYVFCDSAIWNLTFNQIEAYQNVKVVQDKTVLTSDNVIYYGDDNLARFRGELVQVKDKDGNTLRTRYLDYNTEDSVAKFFFGGAMKTSKGEIIEGDRGTYDAKTGIFRFEENVEMFTDSLFIKTKSLDYNSDESKAYFGKTTHMWKNDGYLFGDYGWYAQDTGVVYFDKNVYLNNPDYEGWCDTLYFFQHENRGLMYKDVQLLDSLHNTFFVSDGAKVQFDSINNIYATLFNDPASIYVGENENHEVDSLFCRADTMQMYTIRVCDITDEMRKQSEDDKMLVNFDAIGEADRKAQEKVASEREEAIKNLPEYKAYKKRQEIKEKARQDSLAKAEELRVKDSIAHAAELDSLAALGILPEPEPDSLASAEAPPAEDGLDQAETSAPEPDQPAAPLDSLSASLDSLSAPLDSLSAPLDSLAAAQDSLAAEVDTRDTTQLRFVKAFRNVKIFRKDLQARCDSLYFSQADTLVRLYQDPVIWNEGIHQISGGSMILRMSEGRFDRANVHEEAMILSEEDTVHYNQVKSTDMLGYFNDDNTLRRFDALGGVNAMFYVREDSVITVLNSKEAQFMMVTLKDGFAERLKYYETVKSDAFPVYDLPLEKQRLKGFNWRVEEKPANSAAITTRRLRNSRRVSAAVEKLPEFKRANQYYDNYMVDIYKQIEDRRIAAELEQQRRDSIADAQAVAESLAAADTAMGVAPVFAGDGEVIMDSLMTPDRFVGADTVTRRDMRRLEQEKKQQEKEELLEQMAESLSETGDKATGSRTVFVKNDTAGEISEIQVVQTADDGHKLTRAEKKALKKAARRLRKEARKAEKEARKAEKALRIEKASKPAEAEKSAEWRGNH
ncbi:MAG: hypothetical protein KBT44_02695 [Bacteroidales bacterium]|nr:hypothetical protein [Candidatus Equibacterium intestinale]